MADFHEAAARIARKRMAGDQASGMQQAAYDMGGPSLFWMALRLMALTILTLGIYRFWMTTKLRRYYWSAIRLGGVPFEYTGTGLEKLMGFLIALVVLAIYLGLINLGLAFAGLFSTDDPLELQFMLQGSLITAIPLVYYATYRARRYVLARTRWRGIRFGMEQAAWGYTWRAMILSLLTFVTGGLAYPYQHFMLEKYKWDRSWFGTLKFEQNGVWLAMFGFWIWFYIVGALISLSFIAVAFNPGNPVAITVAAAIGVFGYLAIFLIWIRYQVATFRYLWDNRTLGATRFQNNIDTGEVIGIYVGGGLAVGVLAFLMAAVTLAVIAGIGFTVLGENWSSVLTGAAAVSGTQAADDVLRSAQDAIAMRWLFAIAAIAGYILIIFFALALSQVFIVRPILKRKTEGMIVANLAAAAESQQRAHDDAAEAGGFADALGVDVGAGF